MQQEARQDRDGARAGLAEPAPNPNQVIPPPIQRHARVEAVSDERVDSGAKALGSAGHCVDPGTSAGGECRVPQRDPGSTRQYTENRVQWASSYGGLDPKRAVRQRLWAKPLLSQDEGSIPASAVHAIRSPYLDGPSGGGRGCHRSTQPQYLILLSKNPAPYRMWPITPLTRRHRRIGELERCISNSCRTMVMSKRPPLSMVRMRNRIA